MTVAYDDDFGDAPEFPDEPWSRRSFAAAVLLLTFTAAMLLLWPFIFYRIGPGERGVGWTIESGTVLDETYGEGLHAIAPWDAIYIYDTRVQEIHDKVTVLAANGLPITVTFSGRFRPDRRRLPLLHESFGADYERTLVRPEMVAAIRGVVGRYRPEELYTRPAGWLLAEIRTPLQQSLARNYVGLHEILLMTVRLTPQIERAIDEKLTYQQQALGYEYRLSAERLEADRKRLEAAGIRDFQAIAGPSALRWRGLDVTSELARSPNAKVVIVGNGNNQLPVLVGNEPK